MGLFMGCTAIRSDDPAVVRDAVVRYCDRHGVHAEPVAGDNPESEVASVFPSQSRWVLVTWPSYFSGAWPAARWLSAELSTAASAVEVVAGNYWTHAAFDKGAEVDRFSVIPDNSVPFELENDDAAIARIRRELAGDAERLGALFDRPAEVIKPYLVHVLSLDLPDDLDLADLPKAHPDDRFDLCDCWVFTDFWSRVGISYPNGTPPVYQIRLAEPGHEALPTTLD
jgi:hypothetical protein